MGRLIALDSLLSSQRVWRGQSPHRSASAQATGHAALDAALPSGGWPEAALSELLLPGHGVGELELMWPALARLSQVQAGGMIVLVDPPFLPYPAAWRDAGVALPRLQVVRARHRDALWAAEQCLRSGACAAVLCWPQRADDRVLRRLQVAAETGQSLGFVLRDLAAARNPSPAALRIAIDTAPRQLRVLKCRGGNAPARPIAFAHRTHAQAAGAPVAGWIADDPFAAQAITAGSITTSSITAGSIPTSSIAAGAVATSTIAANTIAADATTPGSTATQPTRDDSTRIDTNPAERNRLVAIATTRTAPARNRPPPIEADAPARTPRAAAEQDHDHDAPSQDPIHANAPPPRAAPAPTPLRPR